MHVAWVTQDACFAGGAERYVANTAALLAERGVQCTLLHVESGTADPAFTGVFGQAVAITDLALQLDALSADVIYAHQLRGRALIETLADARAPVLRFLHDHHLFCLRSHKYTTLGHRTCTRTVGARCYPCLGFVNRRDAWPGIELRRLGPLAAERRANQRLRAIAVGSGYMKDHVCAHGFDPETVHVLPLYVSPPSAPAAPVVREPGLLLFVGALLRGKGLDVLLGAMRRLDSGVRLIVVGGGRQEALYRRQVSRLGLGARVDFRGTLDASELTVLYRRAACAVVPSREPETFGLVGPEAMLAGAPVVACAVGGVGEWLEDGVTGLAVPSGDEHGLARAIERVLEDPEAARARAEEAETRCVARLGPARHVDALLEVLQGLTRPGAA